MKILSYISGGLLVFAALVYLSIQGYDFWNFLKFEKLYENKQYEKILSEYDSGEKVYELHNLGVSAYRMYQSSGAADPKYLTQALEYFNRSLYLEEHPDTRYNYEFIKRLLEDIEEEIPEEPEETPEEKVEETPEEQEGAETGSGAESETQESTQKQQEENQGKVQINSRDDEYRLGEEEQIDQLTDGERETLEDTIEQLKQEQLYNQKFFNKEDTNDGFNNILDMFFNNKIDRGGEKDW